MDNETKSLELLLSQREHLLEDLSNINSVFHKTIFAFFTGIITLIAAESFLPISNRLVIMILMQIIIIITIFIQTILISGNIKRYYIWAIDDFIEKQYKINVLFYQGKISKDHTIGYKHLFPIITTSFTIITIVLIFWIITEYNFFEYICSNIVYNILVLLEFILIIFVMIYNFINKFRTPKEYLDCINHLNRKK